MCTLRLEGSTQTPGEHQSGRIEQTCVPRLAPLPPTDHIPCEEGH